MLVSMNFWLTRIVLPEKDMLEKASALKRFEYSPVGKELKKQTNIVEKQYQDFDKVFNCD